jgi:hypothetical protein
MKFSAKMIAPLVLFGAATLLGGAGGNGGCAVEQTGSDVQRDRQQAVIKEGVSAIGVPAIVNFREMRQLKDIYELRDQDGLVTYTYTWSEVTGKPTFFCDSIGYGIPYATQFTAGEAVQRWALHGTQDRQQVYGSEKLPQPEPNGLYPPAAADGTWIMCKEPGSNRTRPQYVEPKVLVLTYKMPGAN